MGRGENSRCRSFWRAQILEVCSVKAIWIVQACVDVRGQVVDMFNGAYTTLAGARASLERLARQQGKALEWEGPGPLGIYGARIGAERYTVAETALHD
jgi:hypothetical protein